MSGAQTSTFAPPNVLLNTLSGAQTAEVQQNQLMNQGRQLDLSNANMEQVSRVAAALLNEPDPAKRAELYPRYVGSLQSQGYAMHAPATLPDEGTLQMLARQGTPSQTQAEWAQNLAANKAYLNANNPPATPGTGAGATPAAGQGPSFAGGIAGFESGGVSNPPENPRWPVAKGGPAGPHQFIASTWNSFAQANPDLFKGMTPDQILAARTDTTPVGPNGEDRSTLATNWYAGENAKVLQASNIPPTPANLGIAHALGAGGATKVLSAPDNTPLSQVIPETIPQNPEYGRMTVGDLKQRYARLGPVGGTGTAIATATPATAPAGGGGSPGRTQVASTVPVALPAATTEPQPSTVAAPPSGAPQFTYNGRVGSAPDSQGGVQWADGNYGSAPAGVSPVPVTAAPPPAATAAAAPAPTAQPGQLGVRQPPQPPQPPPAAPLPPPPQMPVLNANGLTDLQQRQVNAIAANPQNKQPAVAAAQQAFVNQNIQLRQQAYSDYMQQQQLAVAQGTLSNAQYEARLKAWQAANPVPTTPRFTQGSAVWNPATTQYEPVTPDNRNLGTPVLGHWGINNTGQQQFFADSPAAAQRQREAEAAGTAAGTQTVKQYDALLARASNAAAQEGQIDYATNQLREATKGGIPTGYFSQGLATAAAAAKSLGLTDTLRAIGVDPEAVGNVQTAQKTLSVIGGAILRQALGPGSAVTDAKVEQFIHTQPGIETDPQALQRIMAWARSQFTYEREMGRAAAEEAGKDENNGVLPPTFIPRYYATHGFAPVYDPTSGEMRQPDGRQPERETPPALDVAPVNPSSRAVGKMYSTPKGPMKWTGTGWLPVQ